MASKKAQATADKKVKAALAKLRSDLKATQAKRDRWKRRAVKAEASVADLQARLKAAEQQLKKAVKKAKKAATAPPVEQPVEVQVVVAEPAAADDGPDPAVPDASWTVVRLREEARRRGIEGASRKTKAGLLAALS